MMLGAAALALAACQHPENYRWKGDAPYERFVGDLPVLPAGMDWHLPSVAVYTYATPAKDSPAGLALKDLSDHGQEAFIQALLKAAKSADQDNIRAALAKPLKDGSSSAALALVEGKYDRTLVATVTKGFDAQTGDRLMSTWIVIKPLNFKFTGYTVIATDHEVLNIEHVQNQTTATGQLQASLAPPAPSKPTIGLTGSLSNVYTTSADINEQFVGLGADIMPDLLRINRESERNQDVAGNTLISLSVQTDPDAWHQPAMQDNSHRVTKIKLDDAGKLLAPSAVTFETTMDKASPHCALVAEVSLVYQLRHVTANARSYVEGEQEATIEQRVTAPVIRTIVPADEVRSPRWQIFAAGGNTPLAAADLYHRVLPLTFTDYEAARNFAQWLTVNAAWLAGKKPPVLGKSGMVLTSGIVGVPLAAAPFSARREPDPANNAAICEGMNGSAGG